MRLALVVLTALPLLALDQPVRAHNGLLSGIPGAVTVFKGVPFAAPPVGDLRWRAPRAAANWQGIRKADAFGANCMQQIVNVRPPWTAEFMAHGDTSEDCLYLNLWTAAARASEKRPVLMFIHGGGFNEGSASIVTYDGEALAKKGLVVVDVNYRMGVLGFLAHPELTKESDRNSSGNYGLLDQLAALQWIHDNIAAFGGDPANVTIAGQSAGGMSVHALAGSPLAKGLFHRAIVESGPMTAGRKLADAEQDGVRFAAAKGARSIADLRALTWAQLTARIEGAPIRFAPIQDGWLRPAEPAVMDVPFLVGSNADENGASPHPAVTLEPWRQRAARYGDRAEAYLRLYPATEADVAAITNAAARDAARTQLYNWAIERGAKTSSKTFTYFFSHPLPGPDVDKYGAFHTADVPYFFNTVALTGRPIQDADRKLADTMSSYWANFARTGDPNGKGLPAWPAVSTDRPVTMELGDTVRPIPVADPAKLDFLRQR